jgi:hypothetical protein
MRQGCVAGANDGGEGNGGVVADIAGATSLGLQGGPPPKYSSTGTPTASPIRCGPWARSRPTEPNRPQAHQQRGRRGPERAAGQHHRKEYPDGECSTVALRRR